MVQIQINITDELSKKLAVYKIENDLKTKADAIIQICEKNTIVFKGKIQSANANESDCEK